jgi:hypothetical protein
MKPKKTLARRRATRKKMVVEKPEGRAGRCVPRATHPRGLLCKLAIVQTSATVQARTRARIYNLILGGWKKASGAPFPG